MYHICIRSGQLIYSRPVKPQPWYPETLMSIMVTGGTGFIGHRIIRKLVDRGEEVVCFRPGSAPGQPGAVSGPHPVLPGRHRPDTPPAGSDQHLWGPQDYPHGRPAAAGHRGPPPLRHAGQHSGSEQRFRNGPPGPASSGWSTPAPSRFTESRKPLGSARWTKKTCRLRSTSTE